MFNRPRSVCFPVIEKRIHAFLRYLIVNDVPYMIVIGLESTGPDFQLYALPLYCQLAH